MSRYQLLLLLNLPFILLSILSAVTRFKLKRSSKKRLIFQVSLWMIVFIGLSLAETIYDWLFKHNLTQTEPLSLFDVIQITAIIIVFYIASRSHTKIEVLERRVQDLHQELSIRMSDRK